jgi:hypothetical protein
MVWNGQTPFTEKNTASKGQRRRIYSDELLNDGIEGNLNSRPVSEASRLGSEIRDA